MFSLVNKNVRMCKYVGVARKEEGGMSEKFQVKYA